MNMSKCKNCGKEIPSGANVCCENCGESVDQVLEDALKSWDKDYKVKSWEDMQKEGFSPFKSFGQGQIILKVPGGPETEIIQTKPHYFLWFIFTLKQWWERRKEKKKIKKMAKAFGDPSKFTSMIHVPERNRIDLPVMNPMTEVKIRDTFDPSDPSIAYTSIDPTRTNILPAGEMKKSLLKNPLFNIVETPSLEYLHYEMVERIMDGYPCCMKPDYRGKVINSDMYEKEYVITCETCKKHFIVRHSNFL